MLTAARNKDVEIAILTSVVVHLLFLSWLVFETSSGIAKTWLTAAEEAEQKPEEQVTLLFPDQVVEIPPPEKKEPEQYIRTTQNANSDQAPENPDFISDRNTVAASELPADPDGEGALPTQEGIEPQRMELADRDFKDGEIGEDETSPVPLIPPQIGALMPPPTVAAAPPANPLQMPVEDTLQPPPPASEPPPPDAKSVDVAKAEVTSPLEQLLIDAESSEAAKVSSDRPPAPEPPDPQRVIPDSVSTADLLPTPPTPSNPTLMEVPPAIQPPDPVTRTVGPPEANDFSPFTRTSRVKGTISNRGEAAVNAAETPVGRYMRQVTSAVEKRWHVLRRHNADAVTFGSLRLRFHVTPDGGVEPPHILSNRDEADARMIDFTLQAILEADIPPIPEDLLPLLDRQRLEVEYDVLIY